MFRHHLEMSRVALSWTPLGMLAVGALAGCLPAWKAYATDVAADLLPTS